MKNAGSKPPTSRTLSRRRRSAAPTTKIPLRERGSVGLQRIGHDVTAGVPRQKIVGNGKTETCGLPSIPTSCGPSAAARGADAAQARSSLIAPGFARTSALTTRTWSWAARIRPRLAAAPYPRFASRATTIASGKRSRTSAVLPSDEALSTTIVSATLPDSDFRHGSRTVRELNDTTTADTSAEAAGRAEHGSDAIRDSHGNAS